MTLKTDEIAAIVLAGGRARRMDGADKALITLAGKPLLAHLLDRLSLQLSRIIINANGDPARFDRFFLPVIADRPDDSLGPLAGILAGLDAIADRYPACQYGLSLAADTPFIPLDLVERLAAEARDGAIVRACSKGRTHPVFALWPVNIRAALRDRLINHDTRKIDAFTSDYRVVDVDFAGIPDPFFNINTPEDKEEAERIVSRTQKEQTRNRA